MKASNPVFMEAYCFLRNMASIQFYKYLKINFAHPIRVIAQLNNDCNSKCNMCDVWRQSKKELTASVWINTLKQLKSSYKYFHVGFAGGEILLKDDVFEIFEFCHDAKLPFTITTNGKLLTIINVERLLKLHPLSINISIDSLDSEVYHKIRGVSFVDSVKSNIEYLRTYIKKNSLSTKVFFKTVVNSLNLKELPSIAKYAKEMDVAGITFDPIRRRRDIFIEEKIDSFERLAAINMITLQDSVEKLVALKKEGINILNSEKRMKQWFRINDFEKRTFCSAPLRDIYINNEGYVRLCDYSNSPIGNIATDNISLVLRSEIARAEKKRLTQCQNPCDYCIHRNLIDYYNIFRSYLRN